MKIRSVLYGYCYENGRIISQRTESEIMNEIFRKYRNGKSLLAIAEDLNNREVEYIPGVAGWNTSRIMRLIKDRRYLGDEKYPALIAEDEYNELQSIREEKNTQKGIDRGADIFQMSIPIRCSICDAPMRRVVNRRANIPIRWRCQARICRMTIGKTDENVLAELTELLNTVIANPEIIEIPHSKDPKWDIELGRLNGEINRLFDCMPIDRDAVQKKMVEYASLKYTGLDTSVIKAQRLKDVFMATTPMKEFSIEFLERTADKIKMYADGMLGIVLENGQEIKREVAYASGSSRTT